MAAPVLLSILCVIVVTIASSHGEIIEVYPGDESEFGNFNDVLANLNSNTTVYLTSGLHQVTEFVLVRDLVSVTFIGQEFNESIITCEDSLGLAFINITDLIFENVTINNCGLLDNNLSYVIDEINSTTMMFHQVLYQVRVSVVFGNIHNLVLSQVNILNSILGILAINVLGNSSFDEIIIENNKPARCIVPEEDVFSGDIYGGGFIMLFTDSINTTNPQQIDTVNLTISTSTFADNSNCGGAAGIATLYESSATARSFGYTLAGGGGLSLFMAQFTYSVSITIVETDFINNVGLYGGGLYVQHFGGSSGNNISVQNCNFIKNGMDSNNVEYELAVGSGGFIFLNAPLPQDIIQSFRTVAIENLRRNTVEFENCTFVGNKGRNTAGLYFYSYDSALTTRSNQNQVHITSCKFFNNSVTMSTGIMTFFDRKYSWIQAGLQVYLNSILVKENSGSPPNANSISGLYDALISIVSINMTLSGNCLFESNMGSSILAVTSNIYMDGEITFKKNAAAAGGALQLLTTSYIVISENADVSFVENSAAVGGGAIYVFLNNFYLDSSQSHDCFLWFDNVDYICQYGNSSCGDPRQMNISISFVDNVSPMGSAVYGSALLSCPWKSIFNESTNNNVSGFTLLDTFLPDSEFVIMPSLNESQRVLSTLPVKLDVDLSNRGTADNPILSYPGNLVEVNATALDALNQSVPLAITSVARKPQSLFLNDNNADSQLGLSGYWFLPGTANSQNVQLYLYGDVNNATVQVSIFSTTSSASTNIFLKLLNCSYGFTLVHDEQSQHTVCRCEVAINDYSQIRCNESTSRLIVSSNFWIGETKAGRYTLHPCLYDYCSPGQKDLNSSSSDIEMEINSQCSDGRGGVLCGRCIGNYGIAFGSTGCHMCGHGEWLIVIFIVMGIVLTGSIAFLDITVAKGYINGWIFFANIAGFLMPIYSEYTQSSNIFFIISLINFDPGFATCLYPKMDSLARVGLSFMFPLYLFALMLLCIIIARHSHRLSRSGFSGPKTFATLLLLCYSSIFKTCVEILGYVSLEGDEGKYIGWRTDPNVEYGHGAHGALIAVAIMFLVLYIIPFSLFLFSPPALLTKTKCGDACRVKYQPIFDAFWAPFKTKFCFWPGLRCILRLIPYVISSVYTYPDNAFGLTIFAMVFLLIHVFVQPFGNSRLNNLETVLLFILTFLALGGLYYPQKLDDYFGSNSLVGSFVVIFILVAYIVLVVIIFFHLQEKFPQQWNVIKERFIKFGKSCYKCRCCHREKKQEETADNNKDDESDFKFIENQFGEFTKSEPTFNYEAMKLENATFTVLREPLLELLDESSTKIN